MRWLAGLFSAVFLGSCAPCYDSWEPSYTSYPVDASERSSSGFGIDDPEHQLDRRLLDTEVVTTRDCVRDLLPLTEEEIKEGSCVAEPQPEIRPCLTIKVAPDWHWDCRGEEQVFGRAPAASCLAKGLTPTAQCPCEFRAIVQDNCTVVVTPNMKLLSGQLVTLFTSCNNGWVGRLAGCSELSVVDASMFSTW